MSNGQRHVFLILGRTGEGKTTLSKRIREKFPRSITLDPLGEYEGKIVENFPSLYKELQHDFPVWHDKEFQYVCRFTSDFDVESTLALSKYLTDVLLVIEECEIYFNPRNPNSDLHWQVRYGRHRNISLLCIARRQMEFNIDLRAQATSTYTFRQIEPRDIDILSQYGFDPDEITALQPHERLLIGNDFLNEYENETEGNGNDGESDNN